MSSTHGLITPTKQNLCPYCDEHICIFKKYQGLVLKVVLEGREVTQEDVDSDLVDEDCGDDGCSMPKFDLRTLCYRSFTRLWQGVLGKGVRVRLPDCVVEGVRTKFPSDNGVYMGFYPE